MKNDELKRKYEQLLMDNTHRIHVQEQIHEINEMKRLTGSKNLSIFFVFANSKICSLYMQMN